MTKKEILDARDKYISLYQKNFNLYQETGEKRYYYAYCKYDDLAYVFGIASSAAEDKQNASWYKRGLHEILNTAENGVFDPEDACSKIVSICKSYINVGE